MRLQNCLWDPAGNGPITFPLHYVYTSEFQYNTSSSHLKKFGEYSSIVGCIHNGDEPEYRGLVEDFDMWCKENNMQLNISKRARGGFLACERDCKIGGRRWIWCSPTGTWGSTWTVDWTGQATSMHYAIKARAGSSSFRGLGPSMCEVDYWGCSIQLLSPAFFSIV